jgi:integrase/recombinase XerC
MPELDEVLEAHLALLRLRGRAERTISERRYAVLRLAAWLGGYAESKRPCRAPAVADRGEAASVLTATPGDLQANLEPGAPVTGFAGRSFNVLNATAADLQAWRASLTTGDGATAAYCAHITGFYRFCVSQGIIPASPAENLPVPSLVRGIPRPISEDELAAALACASPRVRPWLILAAWAGFRAVEIARLRRDRVLDTANPPVLLVARNATKGRKERLIPASRFVLDELRLAGLPRSGWVFPRHDHAAGPNNPWLISHLANRTLREAGSAATLHACRHRFATQLYQATRDIRLVQELLGHSSPAVTAIYAAYDQAGAAAAVEALAAPGRLRAVR